MPWTPEDEAHLIALKSMMTSGVRTVTYRDKSVTYHTLSEIMAAIEYLEAQKNADEGADLSDGRMTYVWTTRD